MQYDTNKIKSVNSYIVHPNWPEEKEGSIHISVPPGIKRGMDAITDGRNPASYYYPTSGVIISAPKNSPCVKGDILYWTWNGFQPETCISDFYQQNIWPIQHAIFAYEHEGQAYTLNDFVLLERLFEVTNEQMTASGITLGGVRVTGGIHNPQVQALELKKKLRGLVKYMPDGLQMQDKHPMIQKLLDVGTEVLIQKTSDIEIEIKGEKYYRTRIDEILGYYEKEAMAA